MTKFKHWLILNNKGMAVSYSAIFGISVMSHNKNVLKDISLLPHTLMNHLSHLCRDCPQILWI